MRSPERSDRVNVGVTADGQKNLTEIIDTGWFDLELDAYRAAIALALARRLVQPEAALAGAETKYNVGSLDRDGRLRTLVSSMFPGARRPYEFAEILADAGLRYLNERLSRGDSLGDIFSDNSDV